MRIDIDIVRVSEHHSLRCPGLLVETRQAYQFSLDLLPVRQWINEEAMIFIDRSDELTVATRGQLLPVTGRNSQAPFGVQCDFGGPTKHGVFDERLAMANELAHLLPLFSTFQHYIRAIHQRQIDG